MNTGGWTASARIGGGQRTVGTPVRLSDDARRGGGLGSGERRAGEGPTSGGATRVLVPTGGRSLSGKNPIPASRTSPSGGEQENRSFIPFSAEADPAVAKRPRSPGAHPGDSSRPPHICSGHAITTLGNTVGEAPLLKVSAHIEGKGSSSLHTLRHIKPSDATCHKGPAPSTWAAGQFTVAGAL